MDSFVTVNKNDFRWPYPKPINVRPVQPPIVTKPKGFYMKRPLAAYCHCDSHQYDPKLNQYKQLAEKEKILIEDLIAVQKKSTQLNNGVLDNPCDTDDDKLKTTYQTDYVKRGLQIPEYTKMIASADSKATNPIRIKMIGLENGYRDPTSFRYTAIIRPTIDSASPVTFATTPETIKDWFRSGTGSTEYQDTISKTGIVIMKSSQQYKEPLPSTRRRFGDPCL